MSALEKAVHSLADALDDLETRLADRLRDLHAGEEALGSAHRHAVEARALTNKASKDLDRSIADLKQILALSADHGTAREGN